MIVEIIGKQHCEGVSRKTGKEFNFNVVHFIGPDRGVIGAKGLEVILEPALYPLESIEVGARYDVQFGLRGVVLSFSKVK